ncbi:MAG: DUF481 domain-containing protein [Gemmatimonadetes bacterium]|nr:DUF481 domain-containing protein [Gemmatimonadota bacterium]MYB98829.1 DUF481 domain-containing protein [Gemmatimonadota bacterium]MYI47328.1 DUF481 domain-containing protein [Gemmatimonadota bacterium]
MTEATTGRRARSGHGARFTVRAAVLALSLLPGSGSAQAVDGWKNSSELSFVRTGGNAASSTLGISTTVTRSWERTELKMEAGGIRTRTTRFERIAVGTGSDYRIEEKSDSEVSAENYHARVRVDRRFSERTSIFVQSGWTRNTFSGIRHRLVNVAGVSTRWLEREGQRLRTAYGFTHTVERDVVPDPEDSGRFLGLRLSTDYWLRVTGSAEWSSTLAVDGNGSDRSDLRADWVNAFSVAMNERLALKTSFRTTFDNQPALARLPLRSPAGEDDGTVLVPREKLDRVFTVALVITF